MESLVGLKGFDAAAIERSCLVVSGSHVDIDQVSNPFQDTGAMAVASA
jgi:hypothetical protein